MKYVPGVLALLLVRLLPALGAQLRVNESPIAKVVGLITVLKATIESEGMKEQKSYDKGACWCEATLARKAEAIAKAKEFLDGAQETILKLSADLGAAGADVKQLEKDVAENLQAQREATEVRDKEGTAFEAEKIENEQCVGALEAAIGALSGAGSGGKKGGFLEEKETMRDAQLLSVAAGVGKVLYTDAMVRYGADHDVEAVRRFVAHPQEFAARPKHDGGSFSAAQVGNNPFGDYAPKSTQITGILKGMYDAFASDIEKDNVDEASKQKSFEELMQLKTDELETLRATLESSKTSEAEKTKQLSETRALRDDTGASQKADEAFFQETKEACKGKAEEWSERSRLRTEELMGIDKATSILTSPEAQAIFANATTTFLQVSARGTREGRHASQKAYTKLRALASRLGSAKLGRLAAEVKTLTGGHFDKVIATIDGLIQVLREEEADDLAHRDRCQAGAAKNENDLEDLRNLKARTIEEIGRMGGVMKKMMGDIGELKKSVGETKTDLREMLEMRTSETANFKQALKDDAAAVQLLNKAIVALTAFEKKNEVSLLQQPDGPEREYTVDQDTTDSAMPAGPYGGKKDEKRGITAILSMLVEDLEKEMETGRAEEAEAEERFDADTEAARKVMRTQRETLVATETALAEAGEKAADKQEYLAQTEAGIGAQKELKSTLKQDCAWVSTQLGARRKKRKAEMDGLTEAKAILGGVEKGDYDELELSTR